MRRTDLGTIENARTAEQIAHMRATIGQGKCPFCDIDFSKNIPIGDWNLWWVWQNPFPYPFHLNHIVITTKRHETDIVTLTPEEMAEFLKILQWVIPRLNVPGGALVMRFGDPKHNAGTLAHLHWQIQVPDGEHTAIAVFSKGPAWAKMVKLLMAEK